MDFKADCQELSVLKPTKTPYGYWVYRGLEKELGAGTSNQNRTERLFYAPGCGGLTFYLVGENDEITDYVGVVDFAGQASFDDSTTTGWQEEEGHIPTVRAINDFFGCKAISSEKYPDQRFDS